ncbi:MAG: hypothetical protein P8099_03165 [Gemmatimonadota bacterium]|jgi:hypothetical protein
MSQDTNMNDWLPNRALAPLAPYLARIAHDVSVRRASGDEADAAVVAAIQETLVVQGADPQEAAETARQLAVRYRDIILRYADEHDRVLLQDRNMGFHVNH